VDRVESEWFRIDSGVRQGCVMSPWLFNLYMDGAMKELMNVVVGEGVRIIGRGDEWMVPCLLYADDLVLCGESEGSLRNLVKEFNRVCKRRGLAINVGKSKVMVMNGVDVQCHVEVDGVQLEQVSEFKYLGYMIENKGGDDAECDRKVSNGRRVAGAITTMGNAKNLNLECLKRLHECMLVPVLMFGSEVMVWSQKNISRVQAVQMDNLRGVLGVRKVDKMRNEYIRELCGIEKGVIERISECILRWFGHVERMEEYRLVKKIYSSECVGIRTVGRPKMRWIDSVKRCLTDRGMSLSEARRMVHNREDWREFCRGR
jgi:hypothetical protein